MADQRSLWGFYVGEAVEVKVSNVVNAEVVQMWMVGTVLRTPGFGHRGIDVQLAEDGRTVAVGDPRSLRKVPKTGEALLAWLDS
jgi:hypothetical protein